jgi:hypothetical protein
MSAIEATDACLAAYAVPLSPSPAFSDIDRRRRSLERGERERELFVLGTAVDDRGEKIESFPTEESKDLAGAGQKSGKPFILHVYRRCNEDGLGLGPQHNGGGVLVLNASDMSSIPRCSID